MGLKHTAWIPGGNVVNHCGERIRNDANFFASPPPEIGRVLSADSGVRRYEDPISNAEYDKRGRLIAVGISLLSVAMAAGILWLTLLPDKPFKPRYWVGFAILAVSFSALGIAWAFIKRASERKAKVFSCSFVGEDGAAIYTLQGGLEDGMKEEILVFAEANGLLVDADMDSEAYVRFGTEYKYNWRGPKGKSIFLHKGTYMETREDFTLQHPCIFLRAAEERWCNYRYEIVKAEFEKDGHVEFAIGSRRKVRVGLGYLEFAWPDGDARVPVEDFESISLSYSMFRFSTRDTMRPGGKSGFTFEYRNVSNAKLFVTLLDQLAGISWWDDEDPDGEQVRAQNERLMVGGSPVLPGPFGM